MTEITSSINSRVRLWKINHSGPGCSFYEFLRVVYFPVKNSCLYNKKLYYCKYIPNDKSLQIFMGVYLKLLCKLLTYNCLNRHHSLILTMNTIMLMFESEISERSEKVFVQLPVIKPKWSLPTRIQE